MLRPLGIAYLVAFCVVVVNAVRTLGSHLWTNDEGEMTFNNETRTVAFLRFRQGGTGGLLGTDGRLATHDAVEVFEVITG